MKYKIPSLTILLMLLTSSSLIVNGSDLRTIVPIDDTYVEAVNLFTPYGREEYLKVARNALGPSFVFMMFDLSEIPHTYDVLSEAKLRLYCSSVTYPHVIGVYWCANITWSEDTLTFSNISDFFRSDPEGYVIVTQEDTWYEWKVINIVRIAMREDYERLTLVLEANRTLEGELCTLFASKDQTTQGMLEYSPQLVFTYLEPESPYLGTIIKGASGVIVIIVVVFLAYRFSKRRAGKRLRKSGKRKKG